MKNLLRISFVAALWVASAGTSFAQWSSDPAVNTLLSSDDSTYMYGEFRGDALHSAYYHVYYKKVEDETIKSVILMQKYDQSGVSQWEGEGITIYPGPNKSWVPGLEMTFDSDGNVYVAYSRVIPMGTDSLSHMCINKVSPDGVLQWGPEGIDLSDGDAFGDYDAKMCHTADNKIVLTFDHGVVDETLETILSSIQLRKIDTDGTVLWSATTMRNDGVMDWSPEFVQLTDNNLMLLYKHDTISLFNDTSILHMQQLYTWLLDPSGVPVYTSPTAVFAYDSILNEPPIAPQNLIMTPAGEVFFSATKSDDDNEFQIYLQKLDATGNAVWAQPSEVSNRGLANVERGDYDLVWLDESEEMVIVWIEKDYHVPTEAKNTIMAQKFDTEGNILWADTGKIIQPTLYMDEDKYAWINVRNSSDGHYIMFWMHYPVPDDQVNIWAEKLNNDGEPVWSSNARLSSRPDLKIGLSVTSEVNSEFVATWDQQPFHPAEPTVCFGQNMHTDGQIGTGIGQQEVGLHLVEVYPNPVSSGAMVHITGPESLSHSSMVTVINAQGRVLLSQQLVAGSDGSLNLRLPILSPGIYLLRIDDGKNIHGGKLLVE